MDMSEFDVILGMDWLTAHRVIIDCDRRSVTAYTLDGIFFMFQGDKHDALPRAVYDSSWQGQMASDECKTHLCFEFISHAILCI